MTGVLFPLGPPPIKLTTTIYLKYGESDFKHQVNGQKVTGHKVTILIGQKVTIHFFLFGKTTRTCTKSHN